VAEKLHTLADDVIALEQYMDVLRSRSFRETLLCAADTPLQRTPDPEALSAMAVAAALQPVSAAPDIHSKRPEAFRGVDNAGIATAHPISKAALMHLASIWPRALPFETLFHTARAHIAPDAPPVPVPHLATDQDAQVLRATLLKGFCCSTTLIRLHVLPPQPVTSISSHPVARPTARLQAQHSPLVTNLSHENVQLTTLQRHLVRASNGRRSHAALLEVLDGVSATELAAALQWLAAHALLVG
jgi:methyltransferase-like protein